MMTLVLITVLMGIVALVLTQSERLFHLGNTPFIQSASLGVVTDLERQLPILLSMISGAEQLDLALRLPLQLESKKGDFVLKARLSSLYGRLNINNILTSDGKIDKANIDVWMRLFTLYPIADSDMFFKLLFDSIDKDSLERGIDTEVSLTQPDFKNGRIANSQQFNHILERYIQLTRDTTILAIPWDRYVGYDGDVIDFNALNPETLSLILPNVSSEKIRSLTLFRTKAYASKEEVIAAEPALNALFDTYFFIYKPGISYNLVCDVQLRENTREEHLKFQYNLLDKRVQRVEFL